MRFFNYLFYRVAGYYINRWKDVRGPVNGITLVSLMQLSNVMLILIIIAIFSTQFNCYFFEKEDDTPIFYSWKFYPCLLVCGLNMLKYLRFTKYEYYKEKWKDEDKSLKKQRGWLILLYVLLTIAITTIFAIYRKYYL